MCWRRYAIHILTDVLDNTSEENGNIIIEKDVHKKLESLRVFLILKRFLVLFEPHWK